MTPAPRTPLADERTGSARSRRALVWIVALGALAAVTFAMLPVRAHLDKAHVTLAFLLVVLVGSAAGGRAVGLVLAALAFLAFDYYFLPPYSTVVVDNPLDWLVLVAFLATSVVATQLLNRAQERAELARRRTVEVERLSMLGSETLNAGRSEDALAAIAEVIRSTLNVDCCEIFVVASTADDGAARLTPGGRPDVGASLALGARAGTPCGSTDGGAGIGTLAAWVAAHGVLAAEHADATTQVAPPGATGLGTAAGGIPLESGRDIRAILVPLAVRDRTVGVLRVAHAHSIVLREEQRQFLDALSYYAALGVERLRLVAAAERAEALRQADQLKSALLAAVSHDLRTPLTTIKALAHDLASRGDPSSRAQAASIEEEADLLNRTVADLMDLSRLNANALPVVAELNSADDLIGATLQRVTGLLAGRAIVVGRPPGDPMLFGRFDFVHALRALGNLVENAIKYSPPAEPIELSVERMNQVLRFAVADRGPGVPSDERARIFEAFYRPPNTPPDVGGAGLGLAIASRLASAQHGTVWHRPREGGGSIFVLELPAADAPPELAKS